MTCENFLGIGKKSRAHVRRRSGLQATVNYARKELDAHLCYRARNDEHDRTMPPARFKFPACNLRVRVLYCRPGTKRLKFCMADCLCKSRS